MSVWDAGAGIIPRREGKLKLEIMTGSAERNGAGEGVRTGIWMTDWEKKVWVVVKIGEQKYDQNSRAFGIFRKATQRNGAFYSVKTVSYLRAAGLLVW